MSWLKRLFCRHATAIFVRNIHGDEIFEWGGKRSIWKCTRCSAAVPRAHLNSAAAIEKSKRILALVDAYHDDPTRETRTALRCGLMDEFAPRPPQ